MKITEFEHKGVKPNGTFKGEAGAVETKPIIRMSKGEGCGLSDCGCSEGYWLMVGLPLKDGIVRGINVTFDDKKEMDRFFREHELTGE